MISDTCREAKAKIFKYLHDQPTVYAPFHAEIADALRALKALETALMGPDTLARFAADKGPNLSATDAFTASYHEAFRSVRS